MVAWQGRHLENEADMAAYLNPVREGSSVRRSCGSDVSDVAAFRASPHVSHLPQHTELESAAWAAWAAWAAQVAGVASLGLLRLAPPQRGDSARRLGGDGMGRRSETPGDAGHPRLKTGR